jgi:hypothetical protein
MDARSENVKPYLNMRLQQFPDKYISIYKDECIYSVLVESQKEDIDIDEKIIIM